MKAQIRRILWNQKVHYRANNIPPLVHIHRLLNSSYTLPTYIYEIRVNVIATIYTALPNCTSPPSDYSQSSEPRTSVLSETVWNALTSSVNSQFSRHCSPKLLYITHVSDEMASTRKKKTR